MGKGSPANTTTTSRVELPPWLSQALQGNVQTGNFLTSGVIPGYSGGAGGAGGYGGMAGTPINIPGVGTLDLGQGQNGSWSLPGGGDYTPPSTFIQGFDPRQIQGMDQILNASKNVPGFNQLGGQTYTSLANFNTPFIGAASMEGSYFDPAKMQAAADVQARGLADVNMGDYYNPYKDQVLNPIVSDLNTSEDRLRAQQRQAARAQGTLRGSGFGLDQATLEGELARARGSVLSPIYSDMYKTATGLAQVDTGRELTAGLANQATQQQGNMTNAQLEQQARAANAGFTQDAYRTNAGLSQQANMSNQDSDIRAATIRGLGAQGLAGANMGAWGNLLQGGQNIFDIGSNYQNLAQRRLTEPLDLLSWRNALATGSSPYFGGQSTTGPSPYGSTGGFAGAIGGAAGGAGVASALGLAGPWGWGLAGLGALAGLI